MLQFVKWGMWAISYIKMNTFVLPISTLTVLEYILNTLDSGKIQYQASVKMWSGYLWPCHLKPCAIEEVSVGNGVLGSASQWAPQIIFRTHKIICEPCIFSVLKQLFPTFANQGNLMHSISLSNKNIPICYVCVCVCVCVLPY